MHALSRKLVRRSVVLAFLKRSEREVNRSMFWSPKRMILEGDCMMLELKEIYLQKTAIVPESKEEG